MISCIGRIGRRRLSVLSSRHAWRYSTETPFGDSANHATETKQTVEGTPDGETGGNVDTPQIKRLMYHARQRGWLELDLIVGNWAEANRQALVDDDSLRADFEALLGVENPDLFKYLTGQLQPPEEEGALQRNAVYRAIRAQVLDSYPSTDGSSKAWLPSGWHDK